MIINYKIKAVGSIVDPGGISRFKYREGRIVKIDTRDISEGKSLVVRYADDSCFLTPEVREIIHYNDELTIITEVEIYCFELYI